MAVNEHMLSGHADTYDDAPLWSMPFGMRLLEVMPVKSGLVVLDIGCGTGFPLLEVAQRLGKNSQVVGIDPWAEALSRLRHKAQSRDIRTVTIVKGIAEDLPFQNEAFDLVISNNGISAVADKKLALQECSRVCRSQGRLIFTVLLPDTFSHFYAAVCTALEEHGVVGARQRVDAHVDSKRKSLAFYNQVLAETGFSDVSIVQDCFDLQFANPEALMSYPVFRQHFCADWLRLLTYGDRQSALPRLYAELERQMRTTSGLRMTVPFACISCLRM